MCFARTNITHLLAEAIAVVARTRLESAENFGQKVGAEGHPSRLGGNDFAAMAGIARET
jgi:hypothetical protein